MRRVAPLARKSLLAVATAASLHGLASAEPAGGQADDATEAVRRCIVAAADLHRVPAAVLVILLRVEGGSLGAVSPNTNATVDIGPMQVNTIWVPEVAAQWGATQPAAYRALRDSFCANVEAGAWILRKALDEAPGRFWDGVGYYHSHDPEHKAHYLRLVLEQALRLQAQADGVSRRSAALARTAQAGGDGSAKTGRAGD